MAQRLRYSNPIHIFLFAFFTCFVILQFIAPFAIPDGMVADLSGMVALNDHDELIKHMDFPWSFMYAIGDRMCHQKVERSLTFSGNQMPFCSRCTALWLGIVLGLGFIFFYTIELNERLLFLIFIGILPIGVDGLGQLFGFWESTNIIRFITGLLAGFVCGISLSVISFEIHHVFLSKVKIFSKKII